MRTFAGTLTLYFGWRFLSAVLLVFLGIFALVALIDYIELMRRSSDIAHVSALLVAKTSFYRVPQVTERILPFCVLIGAMSCYLNLSRRLELVVARAAGISAWQFIAPALVVAFLLGVFATTVYNPVSAILQERSKRYEAELFGVNSYGIFGSGGGTFWLSQRSDEGMSIINAKSSRNQGIALSRQQLLDGVWGADWFGDDRTVDVHVRQLRKKVGDDLPLATVWGVGYRLG